MCFMCDAFGNAHNQLTASEPPYHFHYSWAAGDPCEFQLGACGYEGYNPFSYVFTIQPCCVRVRVSFQYMEGRATPAYICP